MPVNNTAKKGLTVFKSALGALKSKIAPEETPTGVFEFADQKITPRTRQANNNKAVALMRELENDPSRTATAEEKLILSRYTGKGGNLEVEGVKGSQYEYYTPLPLANAMWDLMKDLGFDGGAVLDPCAGTGIFAVGRPENTIMQSVELDQVSGTINGMVNDGTNHNVIVSPFEAIASKTQDNTYDAVITNVPFGSKSARGSNARLDIYAEDDLDTYFVKRSIDKLKYGKLAVFLASTKLMTGASSRKFRQQISLKADLVGAYRLPNKVFHPTGADVVTDIIVYRKHSEELTAKIENLYENGQIELLKTSRVLDENIIAGKYYKTEGINNVLGQVTKVTDWRNKQREIEAVVSDDSLANILKLIRRFPDSRIDLNALDLADTQPSVTIQEGDVRVMAGTTFEYMGGQWVAVQQSSGYANVENFETALMAFHSGMSLDDLNAYRTYSQSARISVPAWANQMLDVTVGANSDAYAYWLTQFALYEALQTDITGKYSEHYTALTSAMKGILKDVQSKKYKNTALRTMLNFNAKAFDGADLSAYWYGTAIEVAQTLDVKSAYENAVYMGRADNFMVSVEEIKKSNPDFNPLTDDNYAVNGDGTKVSLNRDYYVGNYGEFLARINAEIETATDPVLREKLISQRHKASEHINHVDVNKLNLSLRATNIDISIKSDFLSIYGGDDVFVNAEGRVEVQAKVPTFDDVARWLKHGNFPSDVRIYFLNRLLDAINNNTRLTLRVPKDVSRAKHDFVMEAFLKYVREIDATFVSYLHSNEAFMQELDGKLNDPFNKEMVTELDESPIEIDGFSPQFEGFEALQTYQNAEIRRLSRRFEGITGFDVGLGKTMASIATAQNLHNIGVKKRTAFVVPSHTISKWLRDVKMTLTDHSGVLVIGSKENSLESINSANYGTDLNLLIKSKDWRIILMTSDAFTMIPLKDSSIEKYYEPKLTGYDLSKDKDRQAYNAFLADKKADMQGDKGRLPYFEDLGIDSIVFDEAQMFKNGDASEGSGNFNTIRGLSLLGEKQLSTRAVSAKIKSEYVRGTNALGDGVVLLSATPITNSPAEIFTMLSLAVGEKKAKNILGGSSIETVDDFLSTFANTESIEGVDITGGLRSDETFTGFKNVELLKNALHTVANIQTARENDLKIPEQEDVPTSIELSQSDRLVLSDLKRAYGLARLAVGNGLHDADDAQFLEEMSQRLGEPADLIAHPFNLISKMQDLILMGQDAVLERGYYINYIAPEDETLAQRVVDAFNKKPPKFTTKRNYPLVEEGDLKIKKRAKNFGESDEYEITVRAYLNEEQNQLCLTANDMKAISILFEVADKNGLDLKPRLSAKLQSMVDNFKQEQLTPMHQGHAKQIIFCDTLAMHHTIKQALIQYCGVPKSQIAILNASIKPDGSSGKVVTDDVQDIQDGFASNKYTVVIANKKADTGIDLQRGTQAIHHLTTGWTPDSLQQRNGRGVRQGNQQAKVRVYLYNANGTFDEYKLRVINGKSDWINKLMNKSEATGGTLSVAGELSNDELDLMIQADSQEAIEQLLNEREKREVQARLDRTTKQTQMLLTIARRSGFQAEDSKEKVTDALIVLDYKKYVSLLKDEAKTLKTEKLENIQAQKQAIVDRYSGYIPNNTTENWDKGLRSYAEPRGGEPSYISSLRTYGFGEDFKSSELVENVLAEDKGPIHQMANNKYSSIQRMAETSKETLFNYEDSPFSREEREMLFNGTARYRDEMGQIERNGDLVKAVNSETGEVLYGMISVKNFEIKYVFNSGFAPTSKSTISVLNANERATAIQAFIDYELARLNELKVYDYTALSTEQANRFVKFSQDLPEVRQAVEAQLKTAQAEWIKGESKVYATDVRHKEKRQCYWSRHIFTAFYQANPALVQAFNSAFDDVVKAVEFEGENTAILVIPNEKMYLIDQMATTIGYRNRLLDDLYDFAEAQKVKLSFDGADSSMVNDFYQEKVNAVRDTFKRYSLGQLPLPYSTDTVLTDDQKDEILEAMLVTALGEWVSDVKPFYERGRMEYAYKSILETFALDQSGPEAIVKANTKYHSGMGRFKNMSLTGVAFLGTGSFGSAFKSTYKDTMKTYAESIRKKCLWDNRNTCWVVDPEVMLWMMKQDWFKLDEVEFY